MTVLGDLLFRFSFEGVLTTLLVGAESSFDAQRDTHIIACAAIWPSQEKKHLLLTKEKSGFARP